MPRTGRPPVPPAERFWRFVTQRDDCWVWTGSKNNGYGHFWNGAGRTYAHRWAYESMVGEIPDGLTLDHLCRVRACVNPSHLDPTPIRVNTLRGNAVSAINARRTGCRFGHPFTVLGGRRVCRECRKAARTRYRERSAA